MKSTAYVKDLLTGNLSKQHFTNVNILSQDEDLILPENWDLEIQRQFNQEIRQSARLADDNAEPTCESIRNEKNSQESGHESATE